MNNHNILFARRARRRGVLGEFRSFTTTISPSISEFLFFFYQLVDLCHSLCAFLSAMNSNMTAGTFLSRVDPGGGGGGGLRGLQPQIDYYLRLCLHGEKKMLVWFTCRNFGQGGYQVEKAKKKIVSFSS